MTEGKKLNANSHSMKPLFSLSVVFLLAALITQFRHDFVSDSFRLQKSIDLGIDSRFANMPSGGYSREEVSRHIQQEIEWTREETRGKKVIRDRDILFDNWAREQKDKSMPLAMFLYGAAILFLFGGMMKIPAANTGDKNQTTPSE